MEIEIGQLIRAIRRWWWVPVVIGLVLGLLGFGAARVAGSTTYTATTQMLVTSQISGDSVLSEDSRTQTYIALVTSGPVLDRVILELGLEYTREDMVEEIVEAHNISGTQIIEISVTTDDPELSAEIANSLARNFVVTATDLSVGELQRNLDDLRGQASSIRDRVTVIDTRLAEIDTDANAEDAQMQAEITQLERERLQASQTLADLDRSIRDLTTNLSTMSIPVVVTDFATAPEEGQGAVSPVLLALLGVFLGGLIGVALITWSAFTDRTLRTQDQVVSQPILASVKPSDLDDDGSAVIAVLGAKLTGMVESTDSASIAIVSAKDDEAATSLQAALARSDLDFLGGVQAAGSVMTDAEAMRIASAASEVVIVATLNKTSVDELEEMAGILEATKTRVVGTVVIQ